MRLSVNDDKDKIYTTMYSHTSVVSTNVVDAGEDGILGGVVSDGWVVLDADDKRLEVYLLDSQVFDGGTFRS